jgi:hypothetical protein
MYPNSFTLAVDFCSTTQQRILGSWTLAASMTEPLMLELLKVKRGFVLIWYDVMGVVLLQTPPLIFAKEPISSRTPREVK